MRLYTRFLIRCFCRKRPPKGLYKSFGGFFRYKIIFYLRVPKFRCDNRDFPYFLLYRLLYPFRKSADNRTREKIPIQFCATSFVSLRAFFPCTRIPPRFLRGRYFF